MNARQISVLWLSLTCSGFAAAPNAARIDSITLERTWCNGPCPIYSVTIRRDGTVLYDGTEYVRVTGRQSRKIPSDRFQQLVRAIQRIGFFSLEEEYLFKSDGPILTVTDAPTTITTVRAGKFRKRVKNYYGGPQSLAEFEKLIDKVAGTSAWIGRGPNKT